MKYIGIDDIAGDFQFPEKSKKGKVRSLSAVARALSSNCSQDYEMGCDLTEKVNALPAQSPSPSIIATNRRFKIPKKVPNYTLVLIHAVCIKY